MRIGILLTNNDDSAFARVFPNDGLKVENLLRPHRPSWLYEVISVKDGLLPAQISDFDAYVITGSPASVNDESLPWISGFLAWIREAYTMQAPIVGLCFGHQAIAKALGGDVQRNPSGWGLGTALTQWRSPAPWMLHAMNATTLMAAHNEQVTRMPTQAVCLGGSDFCPLASMQVGQNIWTTQYHPEMSLEFMQALLDHLSSKLDSRTIEQARDSLRNVADAAIFAQWMVNFIESRKAKTQ